MTETAPLLRRHFLAWDRPLAPQVAAWLAQDWHGPEPLDLSRVLAVVPTRQSGRRLREALAGHAAARGGAVFPPRVKTPDTLLADGAAGADVASRLEALLAWTEVLREVDLAAVPEVFPVAPARRDFAWAWRLAESFARLQSQLNEGGLALADVPRRMSADFAERARWEQLAALEAEQVRRLAARDRREPHAARRAFARAPARPENIARIVVLAAPDPLPLALEVLGAWAREVPVEIVVFAPENEAAAFDAWGRPEAEAWSRRALALGDFAARVHLCADPADEAERAASAARGYGAEADGAIALGVADAEALPLLENELTRAGLAGYNPEGRPRRGEQLHGLLTALATLGREASYEAVAALARCPDLLAALERQAGARGFSAAEFLQQLDAARAGHLPADLAALRAVAEAPALARGLEFIAGLEETLRRGPFPENAVAALQRIFERRRFDLARAEEARAAEAIGAWREAMRACRAARAAFPGLRPPDGWEVALRLFGESRRTEEKAPGALELQGWLELLWEDAPHLVVVGLNDGLVPEAIVGDAFLPESLRAALGLKTNAARFARDAYLLQALAAWRGGECGAAAAAGEGAPPARLDLCFAKYSSAGDPLRPSRLLLRCADAELPGRVERLFRAPDIARANLPWTRAWQLTPRPAAPPARVAVTGLRAWLACPFRFYLAQVLRMEPVDPAKAELDARDFGTLVHAALEAMAGEAGLRDCADERTLREFLLAQLDRAARARYGETLTLPLVVQLESARQRLARAAVVQARERAAGWVIERAEEKFALPLGGLEIRGKIDRIDRHEPSGARRVLDYKTSDTAVAPAKAHLRPLRAGDERLPGWMRVTLGGREHVWADLQLPLYLRALGAEGAATAVQAGYFNLPKAVGETAVALWPELGGELLAAAHACAEGVAGAIRAGEFWPPAEMAPDRDAFAALFHHGAEDSVAKLQAPSTKLQ